MQIAALNRWRQVYLAETVVAAGLALSGSRILPRPAGAAFRATLVAGAALWLMHDLAHGRWRAASGDVLALAGAARNSPLGSAAAVAGVAFAAARPERPPSPFIWRRAAQADERGAT